MESYEVEVNGKVLPGRDSRPVISVKVDQRPVKPIRNLSGHSINPYQIHGGKSVMLVKNEDPTKMEEGDYFAIETFGSTGRGWAREQGDCSHYAKRMDAPAKPVLRFVFESQVGT